METTTIISVCSPRPVRMADGGASTGPSTEPSTGFSTGPPNGLARTDLDRLYLQLRSIARHSLRHERTDHTLQATALVHEAWIRLLRQHAVDWNDPGHLQALMAQAMRRILVDSARRHHALKRGGAGSRVEADGIEDRTTSADEALRFAGAELLVLDEALAQLAAIDPVQAQIVELRVFGECTLEQIARRLEMPRRSVDRSWASARAWLCRAVRGGASRRSTAA